MPYGLPTALALWLIAMLLTFAAWGLIWCPRGMRRVFAAILLLTLHAAPFAVPIDASVWIRGICMLAILICPLKVIDLLADLDGWRQRSFPEWMKFVLMPSVLVRRCHPAEIRRSRRRDVADLVRGIIMILIGAAILRWAFTTSWSGRPFILQHTAKALGLYFAVLDGGFLTWCAILRLSGHAVIDFSRTPILAVTPADFWRRYNRDAGRFLYEDIAVPLVGRRRLMAAIAVAFLANAIAHEYLSAVMTRELLGYQLMFFGIHGFATMVTARLRPRGIWGPIGIAMTLSFNLATSWLFFANADQFVNWYE